MHFRLTRDGVSRSEVLSIYSEIFAAIGIAEYSKATDDDRLWERAIGMYDAIMPRLGCAEDTPLLGYPIDAEFHLHAHDMCRITVWTAKANGWKGCFHLPRVLYRCYELLNSI